MRELTVREREAVGGGIAPIVVGAAVGAATAGAGYLGGSSKGRGFSWKGFGKAVATGAAAGAVVGPLPRIAAVVGAMLGR